MPILAGLTSAETDDYLDLSERQTDHMLGEGPRLTEAESDRLIELHKKHEVVRFHGAMAGWRLNPTRH
jgi:hypothetical protein